MTKETQKIPIEQLEVNKGQIKGLPKNPRFIREERFAALIKSIQDAPEMLQLRELIVVKHGKKYVTIGGNMRLRACIELGYKEVPCKVLPEDTPVEKLREYAIKDNNGFGENDWDILSNEWDSSELSDWGVDMLDWQEQVDEDEENMPLKTENEIQTSTKQNMFRIGHNVIYYTEQEKELLERKIDEYVETYQNTFGFITWLINGDS